MRFQYKIFLLFTASILLSLVTTTYYVFALLKQHSALYENAGIEQAITSSLHNQANTEQLLTALQAINKEYVKAKVLKKDIMITGVASLILFLLLQSGLLFIVLFFVIRAVTAQLNLICNGIRNIEKGAWEFRFPALKGHEFHTIGEALNRMLCKLADNEIMLREQSKLAGWQEVSAFLSHQLKNPLTAITLAGKNIGLCLEQGGKEALIRSNWQIIDEEALRIASLLNRLREVSTFPEPVREVCDINAILRTTAERFPQITFHWQLNATPPLLLDKQLLEQVFINLYSNSAEAASPAPVTVFVASEIAGGRVVLTVRDSISGLPSGIAEKIFTPRFSTKRGGMGLGLTFVKKIIGLHGGEITVCLSPVQGLVFTITFPTGD